MKTVERGRYVQSGQPSTGKDYLGYLVAQSEVYRRPSHCYVDGAMTKREEVPGYLVLSEIRVCIPHPPLSQHPTTPNVGHRLLTAFSPSLV